MSDNTLEIQPLTPERWVDLVDLFGPGRGANGGCWCMWTILRGRDFDVMSRDERRRSFETRVAAGPAPGLLMYREAIAVGWVAVGPRSQYERFQRSKISKPLDSDTAEPVINPYAITCFYIRSGHRKSGLMRSLAEAAIDHARDAGADQVDACPIDPDKPLQWGEGFVGLVSVFRDLGFSEVARRSSKRPLMRLII